jgi:cytochrome c-type biogenesis protein CcmH
MHHAILVMLFLAASLAWAADPAVFSFDDPAVEQRFQRITQELRCLVCQNQSLADSHAELAGDLRREIHAMMQAGRSEAQIIEFMVRRYGDFVLYRPPLTKRTLLLWFGPAALFLVAALLVYRNLRRRARLPPPALSAAERQRVANFLDERPSAASETPAGPPDAVHRP